MLFLSMPGIISTTRPLAASAGAALCRRGHVIHQHLDDPRVNGARCDECGAKVIVACEVCGYRIRGAVSASARSYERPSFCDGCGSVFPWTGRRQRLQHLQNVIDDIELDPATQFSIVELLEELLERAVDDQGTAWEQILRLAPELWSNPHARPMLVTLVPAAVKRLRLA